MPDEAAERRCAFAARCRRSERLPGTTRLAGALLTTPVGLSRPCQYRVADVVADLPAHVVTLTSEIGVSPQPGAARVHVARTPGQQVPIRLALDAFPTHPVRLTT